MSFVSYNNSVSLGDILTALTFLGTIVAGIVSLRRFSETVKNTHYAELDNLYADLLKLTITDPFLNDPGSAEAREKAGAYNSYAFLVLNFLETIVDRVPPGSKLCRTWYPIIRHEFEIHKDWLTVDANRRRFKAGFVTFIESGKWKKYC